MPRVASASFRSRGSTGPEEDAVRPAVVAFERRADEVLEQTCGTARRLIGAHQAAITLMVPGDWSRARKYFSLSARYAAWRDFRAPARAWARTR